MRLEECIKQRLVVLTDISNEPDDEQSLVRLLVYATDVDIEGLVATTSVHLRGKVRSDLIRRQLEAYREILPNLKKHHSDYPDADQLLELVGEGPTGQGMKGVGDEFDTSGSDRVITAVDRDDPRPVWVTLWGGANCLAQALWKVHRTRSEAEIDTMDWCITERYEGANHNPIAAFRGQTGKETVHLEATAGERIDLSAEGSSDPDGNDLQFTWTCYKEAGTYAGDVTIEDPAAITTSLLIPSEATGSEIHILLTVKDNGDPPMRSYRRIIIHVASS